MSRIRSFVIGCAAGGASYAYLRIGLDERKSVILSSIDESYALIPGYKEKHSPAKPSFSPYLTPVEHPYFTQFRETWNRQVVQLSRSMLNFFSDDRSKGKN